MKRSLAVLFLLSFAIPASAQSITVPETVTVPGPGLVVIRASAMDCDDSRWYSLTPGIQTFPPDVVTPKPGVFLGLALVPGTYRIGVVPAKAVNGKAMIGEAVVVTVTVGGTPPVPPVPPTPTDPLTQALQAAYDQETTPNKAAMVSWASAVFANAGPLVDGDPSQGTPGAATNADLFGRLSVALHRGKDQSGQIVFPAGALPKVEKAWADHFSAQLGTSPTAPVDKVKAKAALLAVSKALAGVK